jgi:hypothetical protein
MRLQKVMHARKEPLHAGHGSFAPHQVLNVRNLPLRVPETAVQGIAQECGPASAHAKLKSVITQ